MTQTQQAPPASGDPTPQPGPRLGPIIGVIAALSLAMVAAAVYVTIRDDNTTTQPLQTAASRQPATQQSATTAAPLNARDQAVADATKVYRDYIALLDDISRQGGSKDSEHRFEPVARGLAKADAHISMYNQHSRGDRMVGGRTVTNAQPRKVQLNSAPPRVELDACIDMTKMHHINRNGSRRPGAEPYAHMVVLVTEVDGVWKVQQSEFVKTVTKPC